jgi:hypothetical protein
MQFVQAMEFQNIIPRQIHKDQIPFCAFQFHINLKFGKQSAKVIESEKTSFIWTSWKIGPSNWSGGRIAGTTL